MNNDAVFYDEGGPGEEDGFPWCFAPDDSALCDRFGTKAEAEAAAADWIANRAVV